MATTRAPRTAAADLQQHDLIATAAKQVLREMRLRSGETVLEVGPGTGAITAGLLEAGAHVEVIEIDASRCRSLGQRFERQIANGALVIHPGDAKRIGPRLKGRWRVAANPPFNLTADLIRRWLLDPPGTPPEAFDLVLQYEAARKLCGRDGAHSRSSVLTRLTGKPWISLHLRRQDVQPPSRVDLCLWSMRRLASAPAPDELRTIDRLLEKAFAGPRSMADALRGIATGTQLRRQAAEQGWRLDQHPRELKPVAWRSLAAILVTCGQL